MTTKISPYKNSDMRFGRRGPEPHDYSVKTWFLTPEQLEAYKNGDRSVVYGLTKKTS
ncbi:hypothetical protein [Metabacillus sp. Hm71]|uniref:hypothetical protein n=1 Tax=Metabacillus sp. Hm71 TaxID=3450743 RepID=UPI003F427727